MKQDNDRMMGYVQRREWLKRYAHPVCPRCQEEFQIELIGYIEVYPAMWKCRTCKLKFEYDL